MTQFFKIHTPPKQLKDQKVIHKHVINNYFGVAGTWMITGIFVLFYIFLNFYNEQVLILLLRNYGKENGGIKRKK